MIEECWRHAKVIGAWGPGVTAVERCGVAGTPGVVVGEDASAVFTEVQGLMAAHRVWERFPASVS
jgi:catalase